MARLRSDWCALRSSSQLLTTAIDMITAAVNSCQFVITPFSADYPANSDYAQVDYHSGDRPYYHTFVQGAGCPTPASWDYADATQTSIVLCPSACALVQADPEAWLDLHYGCMVGA